MRSMSTGKHVLGEEFKLTLLDGENQGIALMTMDRPKARNALGRQMIDEMREALEHVKADVSLRCVVLESAVDRVFCAGADLKERAAMTPTEASAFVARLQDTFSKVGDCPVPVIAAVEGAALGGGLELAMAADLRVAGGAAQLGLPETGLAIIPGAGGTQRLPRLVGPAKAKELIFTGRRVQAEEAAVLGLVNEAVEAGDATAKALELGRAMLDKGPLALRAAKLAINGGADLPLVEAMAVEQDAYALVLSSKDRLEGLAAFREKRKPVYKGE